MNDYYVHWYSTGEDKDCLYHVEGANPDHAIQKFFANTLAQIEALRDFGAEGFIDANNFTLISYHELAEDYDVPQEAYSVAMPYNAADGRNVKSGIVVRGWADGGYTETFFERGGQYYICSPTNQSVYTADTVEALVAFVQAMTSGRL